LKIRVFQVLRGFSNCQQHNAFRAVFRGKLYLGSLPFPCNLQINKCRRDVRL
jgi:hypothetical protein